MTTEHSQMKQDKDEIALSSGESSKKFKKEIAGGFPLIPEQNGNLYFIYPSNILPLFHRHES